MNTLHVVAEEVEKGQKNDSEVVYLGTNAKSCPLVDFKEDFDKQTGELFPVEGSFDPVAIRLERFALQSAARVILWGSRTAKCLRLRRVDKSVIEVWKSKEHGTATFGGLQTCASVWACPVCAAKISERRRVELTLAIEQHRASGGDVLLITLTNPHFQGDDLLGLLTGQQKAMHRFNSTKAALKFWDSIGCIGTVRAWEVTHGVNGWHPHFHLLAFVRSGVDLYKMKNDLYDLWANSCRLAGLPIPSREHGADVKGGVEAAAYATKWGLEQEMTKGHMKKARSIKGRSPFDLLRAFLFDRDRLAAALFKTYARAFKGKRQLVWSNGLKALFDLGEINDSDLAASQEDSAHLLGEIDLDDWRLILKFDVRGEVLELARHGWEPVERLLSSLRACSETRAVQNEEPLT